MTPRTLALFALTLAVCALAPAQRVDPKQFDGLKWRSIGPYRGGRSLAVSGSTQRPKEYYFGATGGGIWKTTDAGVNWSPVADDALNTASVGAVAVAPSNPDVVYAGTGERDIRGDISHGDGIYGTRDGGKTWSHLGLAETETISRIVVDPTNPDVLFVAALGHVYAQSPARRNGGRGVYKSVDGGKTWNLVLPGGDRAGAIDIVIDPQHPNIVLAATWEAWRTPYTMNSGGVGSRLYRSEDGGATWQDVSRAKGMPDGILGKIGLAISPVDSKRYWALVEAAEGGLFRSDDAGATWTKVNDSRNWRQRAWYYTHVYADPKAVDTVYVLNVGMGRSTDGGKTFSGIGAPHSDHHDLWIAPEDPRRMINANDGGANVSADGGQTWTAQTFPTGQIYHVNTDDSFPYRVLGAQQDNSTIRMPSRSEGAGIAATDWTSTAGGESGYVTPQPKNPDVVYGGNYGGDLSMLNHRTGETRQVDPWPDNPMGHAAGDLVHRFQWTYPIVFSPHDPKTLYTCSQYVLKTTNGGQTWRKISPDLTRNDPSTLGSSGGPLTKDNTSVEYYGTVFTLAESPVRRGVLWAGSDDGLIHVSEDGGGHWRDVTPKGMPKWGLVSIIEASPFDAAVAYAAVDNHENDDLTPFIYRTTDYGRTWTRLVDGIPANSYVRVVREDRQRRGLLYAGTETGIWVSFDAGRHWQSLRLNMPVTPVHDLAWKDGDLVAATHGRGFWILDDLSPLQQAGIAVPAKPVLLAPRSAYRVRWGSSPARWAGANPPSGIVLNYFLPADVKELKFEFRNRRNAVVTTVARGATKAGFGRTSAWLSSPSFRNVPGMILWGAFSSPITLPPGEYTVTMDADGVKSMQKVRWLRDPRSHASDGDLVAQYNFLQRIVARVNDANDAVIEIRKMRAKPDELRATFKDPRFSDKDRENLEEALVRYNKAILPFIEIEEALYQTKNRSGQDPLNYPIRLNNRLAALIGTVQSGDNRPTDQSIEVFNRLSRELDVLLARMKAILDERRTALTIKP